MSDQAREELTLFEKWVASDAYKEGQWYARQAARRSSPISGSQQMGAGNPADRLCDSHWIAGAQFGWNCGIEEDHGGRKKLNEAINARIIQRASPPVAAQSDGVEEQWLADFLKDDPAPSQLDFKYWEEWERNIDEWEKRKKAYLDHRRLLANNPSLSEKLLAAQQPTPPAQPVIGELCDGCGESLDDAFCTTCLIDAPRNWLQSIVDDGYRTDNERAAAEFIMKLLPPTRESCRQPTCPNIVTADGGTSYCKLAEAQPAEEMRNTALDELRSLWPDLRQLIDGFTVNSAWNNKWDASVRERMIQFGLKHLSALKSTPTAPQDTPSQGEVAELPSVCDGKEQDAFEKWAIAEKLNMALHPLHWLFLDPKTYAARQGWKGALEYVNAIAAAQKETKE